MRPPFSAPAAALAPWLLAPCLLAGLPPAVLAGGPRQGTDPPPGGEEREPLPQEPEVPEAEVPEADAPEADAPEAPEGSSPDVPSAEPGGALAAPFADLRGFEEALLSWAAKRPGRVSLEVVGESGAGRAVRAVRVVPAEARGGPGGAGPLLALLWTDPREGLEGSRALLALLEAWLARRDDAAGAGLLALPLLDPDAAAGEGDAARLARDFPAGWAPGSELPGAGPYPLHRPESRALASLLLRSPRAALAVGLGPRAEGWSEAGGAAAEWSAAGYERSAGTPASPLRAAHEHFGVPTWALSPPPPGTGPAALAAWAEERAGGLEELVAGLATLHFSPARAASLGEGLWQLDVELENVGRAPTVSEPARWRVPETRLALRVTGAEVLAAARRAAVGTYAPLPRRLPGVPPAVVLEPLAAGESVALRLVLRAPGAADSKEVLLEAFAARARRAEARAALRGPAAAGDGS